MFYCFFRSGTFRSVSYGPALPRQLSAGDRHLRSCFDSRRPDSVVIDDSRDSVVRRSLRCHPPLPDGLRSLAVLQRNDSRAVGRSHPYHLNLFIDKNNFISQNL